MPGSISRAFLHSFALALRNRVPFIFLERFFLLPEKFFVREWDFPVN
jgi:hypothetical protein